MEKPIFRKWWLWLIAVIVLAALIVVIGKSCGGKNIGLEEPELTDQKTVEDNKTEAFEPSEEKVSEEIQSEQATQNPAEVPSSEVTVGATADLGKTPEYTMYPDGFYKVGENIPAGEYKLFAHENTLGASYFEITADDTGEFSDFIASGNYPNFIYVTVFDGQYFGFDDGYAVPAEEAAPYDATDKKYIPGMYKAGVDIPAGEYRLVFDSNYGAYYAIFSASTHTEEAIIDSGNFTEDIYVTVAAGEYIYFTGAYIEVD